MANTAQSKKRARQAVARTLNNASQRGAVRTAVKKVAKLIDTDVTAAKTEFQNMTKMVDHAGRHNIIHPNKASRLKSRLNKRLKAATLAQQ